MGGQYASLSHTDPGVKINRITSKYAEWIPKMYDELLYIYGEKKDDENKLKPILFW